MTEESHDHGVLIPHRFNAYLEAYARELIRLSRRSW